MTSNELSSSDLGPGDASPGEVRLASLPRGWRGALRVAGAYVELTKPRIVVLLLVTTIAAMLLAAPPWPATTVILATILGGALAAGGANAMNSYFDRDIDPLMSRTRRRPLPTHRVSPIRALIFGTGLGIVSFGLFVTFTNLLAGCLAAFGFAFYIVIYTWLLKRATPANIVIGGAAGAVPPLVGWAATAGHLEPAAYVLFAIIFLWTPPHFWSLALLTTDDYASARVPMLPVVAGEREARRQIFLYSVALAIVSLLPVAIGVAGWLYFAAALVFGGILVGCAVGQVRSPSRASARRMFIYSNTYLALLFLAMVADHLLKL